MYIANAPHLRDKELCCWLTCAVRVAELFEGVDITMTNFTESLVSQYYPHMHVLPQTNTVIVNNDKLNVQKL